MQIFNIFSLFIFLSFGEQHCNCYEGKSPDGDLYILYDLSNNYELIYLSNFHGEYTPFSYKFEFTNNPINQDIRTEIPNSTMTLVKESDRFFCLNIKIASTEINVRLKKRKCKSLRVNKINPKFILKNPFPGFEGSKIPDCH